MKFKGLVNGDVFYEAGDPEIVYEYWESASGPYILIFGSEEGLYGNDFSPDKEVVVIHNSYTQR